MKLVLINPGNIANKKLHLLYLCIGTESRRVFKSKHPHFQIEKEPLKELWRVMED